MFACAAGQAFVRQKEYNAGRLVGGVQSQHVFCMAILCFSIGVCYRIHALFFTDRICCEPLTEWVHFADLREGQPQYMLYLVRIVYALAELCNNLSVALAPYADAGPISGLAHRESQLTDGIPYMLRDPRQAFQTSHVPKLSS